MRYKRHPSYVLSNVYRAILRVLVVLLLFLANTLYVSAQVTRIRGVVLDAETHQPVPDVSIALLGLPVGTITTDEGIFFLETRKHADTLVVASIGYVEQRFRIQPAIYQEFKVELQPLQVALEEVIVRRDVNPALPILDSVLKYKVQNNPRSISLYSTKVYNKIEFDVNNIDSTFFDTPGFRNLRFLNKNIDTNAATGKTFLPVFLSESLSKYYYSTSPKTSREVIYASRMSGVERDDLTEFSGELYQDFNLYENYMPVFNQGLISPIHDNGTFYYHYFLVDSAIVDGIKRYRISFRPKRKQEPTFKGFIWVDTREYAVCEAQYELDRSVNLNFVNFVMVQERFKRHDEKVWFPERKYFFLDFTLTDKTFGIFGHKTTIYDSLILNQPIPRDLLRIPNEVQVQGMVNEYTAQVWDTLRREELSNKERTIYRNVDTIKTLPLYRNARTIVEFLVDGHLKFRYFEIGRIPEFYSFNPVEGQRFAFGGRTTRFVSSHWRMGFLAAYGTLDQSWKWRTTIEYVLKRYPWRKLTIAASQDMEQLGQAEHTLNSNNILGALLRRYHNPSIAPVHQYQLDYFHEIYTGLSFRLDAGYRKLLPNAFLTFEKPTGKKLPSIQYSYFGIELRWKHKEKFFTNYFERKTLGSSYPEIAVRLLGAQKGVLFTDYSFLKMRASITQKISMHPIGYSWLIVKGGVILGRLPYPLLELHEGSNTYAVSRFGYDRLKFYELASDHWVSATVEHHFMGFFLNHVPFIRHLKLRELLGVKVLMGGLSSDNLTELVPITSLRSVGQIPYVEALVGVENIFHVFRVDCVWRLTHTTLRERYLPSVRFGLAFQF